MMCKLQARARQQRQNVFAFFLRVDFGVLCATPDEFVNEVQIVHIKIVIANGNQVCQRRSVTGASHPTSGVSTQFFYLCWLELRDT